MNNYLAVGTSLHLIFLSILFNSLHGIDTFQPFYIIICVYGHLWVLSSPFCPTPICSLLAGDLSVFSSGTFARGGGGIAPFFAGGRSGGMVGGVIMQRPSPPPAGAMIPQRERSTSAPNVSFNIVNAAAMAASSANAGGGGGGNVGGSAGSAGGQDGAPTLQVCSVL